MLYKRLKAGISSLSFVSIIILLQVPMQASAQNSTLRVFVTAGDNGAPLVGANVILRSTVNGKIIRAGSTNNDGIVNYRNIDSKTYKLTVSFIGYKAYTSEIRLDNNQVKVKRITLPVANNLLESAENYK